MIQHTNISSSMAQTMCQGVGHDRATSEQGYFHGCANRHEQG